MAAKKELIDIFEEEARGLIAMMRDGLFLLEGELQSGRSQAGIFKDLFRSSHTLKSSSRVVGLDKLGRIAEVLEEIFKAAKAGDVEITIEMIPLLSRGVIACQEFLEQKEVVNYEELLDQLNRLRNVPIAD